MNARLKVGTILAGAALAATTLFGGVASADSGNLIQNGTFNLNTKGWTVGPDASFAKPWMNQGAVLSNINKSDSESKASVGQCVAIPEGAALRFSARGYIDPDQKRDGMGRYNYSFHASPDCVGIGILQAGELGTVTGYGHWKSFSTTFSQTEGPVAARAVWVSLTAHKAAPTAEQSAKDPFRIEFDDIELKVVGGGTVTCVAFGDSCGEEDEEPAAGGGGACEAGTEGCPGEPGELPVPPVPVEPDVPALEPGLPLPDDGPVADDAEEPVMPGAPATGGQPAEGTTDIPQRPSSGGSPAPGGGPQPSAGGQPANASQPGATSNPAPTGGNPQAKPTLEPQGPGPINSASPTPPPPATGGDSDRDPAGDFSDGEGDSAEIERDRNDSDGLPMTLLGGGLAGLLALLGLGIVLGRSRRRQ